MSDKSFQPIEADLQNETTGCWPLMIDAEVTATGIILKLAATGQEIRAEHEFLTESCTRVSVTIRFPTTGGKVTVIDATSSVVHTDTDGDRSITFYRSSPDLFDADVGIQSSTATPKSPSEPQSLAPKPGIPNKRVKLQPKIGYPPPTSGDE